MENCLPEELLLEYKEAFQMLDKKRTGKITMRVSNTTLERQLFFSSTFAAVFGLQVYFI